MQIIKKMKMTFQQLLLSTSLLAILEGSDTLCQDVKQAWKHLGLLKSLHHIGSSSQKKLLDAREGILF